MKRGYLACVVLSALLASGCASQQAKTESSGSVPKRNAVAAPEKAVVSEARDEVIQVPVVGGEIVGRPAKGSKFAKLKLGMTRTQVEELIGPPTRGHRFNKRPTTYTSTVHYSYRREGVLTFSDADEPLLIRILVNRIE